MARVIYSDSDGRMYRVFAGLGGSMYKAYVLARPRGVWCDVPSLPWRTAPERAEIDLWDYARANGLEARIYGKRDTAPSRAPRQVEPAPRPAQGFGRDRGARVKPLPLPLAKAWQLLSPEELRHAKRKRQRDYQQELRRADREVARTRSNQEYNRRYYEAHREAKLRKVREWREKHSRDQTERRKAYCRQYYLDHREEIARKQRERREAAKRAKDPTAGD